MSGLMMLKDVGSFTGGIIPGIVIAIITKNPEALGAGMADIAGPDIADAGNEVAEIAETQMKKAQCAEVMGADVDREHEVTMAISPAKEAEGWQGSKRYPGVDKWNNIKLKKGQIVMAGEPGTTGFFTTQETVEVADFDATKIFRGLQVAPWEGTYRPTMTAFELTEDINAATSIATTNPQYGEGGMVQYYIPNFESVTRSVKSYALRNTIIGK